MSKDRNYLIEMYNATSTDDGHGELETYEAWLERQLLARIKSDPSSPIYEPYFGWCDVEGCDKEGCSGGNAWSETGYWTVCADHAAACRAHKPQPAMKQVAIDRENSRDKDGKLPL